MAEPSKRDASADNTAMRALLDLDLARDLYIEGMGYAIGARQLMEALKDSPGYRRLSPAEIEDIRAHAKRMEAYALAQGRAKAPFLHRTLCIHIWAILEAFAEDASVAWLEKTESAWEQPAIQKVRGILVEFLRLTKDQQARYIVREIGEAVAAPMKPGVGGFEAVLQAVGLGGPVDAGVRKALLELSQVRNVLLHRVGEVDARFLAACPWRTETVGDEVGITDRAMDKYVQAARWYVMEVESRYARVHWTPSSSWSDKDAYSAMVDRAMATAADRVRVLALDAPVSDRGAGGEGG